VANPIAAIRAARIYGMTVPADGWTAGAVEPTELAGRQFAGRQGSALPAIFPELTDEEHARVCEVIRGFFGG
jgi:hypothetical protein